MAEGPLAGTLLAVLATRPAASASAGAPVAAPGRPLAADPQRDWALALTARAGITEATRLRAALGAPLRDALRDLKTAGPDPADAAAGWFQATGIDRLADACTPLDDTHQPPRPPDAAALRAVALALAEGETDAASVLRTVAATVTLVERRSRGEAGTGEAIILALR